MTGREIDNMVCNICGGDYGAPLQIFADVIGEEGVPEGRNLDGSFTCWRCRAREENLAYMLANPAIYGPISKEA